MSTSPNRRPSGPAQPSERHPLPRLGLSTPALDASRHRGLESEGGAVFWCSNGSAVEPGKGQMGNVG